MQNAIANLDLEQPFKDGRIHYRRFCHAYLASFLQEAFEDLGMKLEDSRLEKSAFAYIRIQGDGLSC